MKTMMEFEDFEERALAYGARIGGWPAEDRAPARALLDESAQARRVLQEAAALDATLDLWDGPQPSHALLSRVLADAATVASEARSEPVPTRAGWREWFSSFGTDSRVLRPGLALAACLALGFVMGTTLEEDIFDAPVSETEVGAATIDFAFAMDDDADLLLGPEAFL